MACPNLGSRPRHVVNSLLEVCINDDQERVPSAASEEESLSDAVETSVANRIFLTVQWWFGLGRVAGFWVAE